MYCIYHIYFPQKSCNKPANSIFGMFKIVAIFILILTFLNPNIAQIIKGKHHKEATKKWKFMLSFDGRRSLMKNQTVKIGGLRTGMQFKNNFRTGIGLYGFDKPFENSIQYSKNGEKIKAYESLNYNYFTLFFEPIIYRYRKWEFSLPSSIGRGKAKLIIADTLGKVLADREGGTTFLEVAGYAENRVFWWIGIGGGIGYRKILNTQIIGGKKLDGPYYQLAIKIYIGEVVRRIFTKKETKQQ